MRRWVWAVVVAVLLVWALTATSIAALKSGSASEVGTWADWATAGVTFLALLAATWAGIAAQGQLRAARDQLRLAEVESAVRSEEARERQARQVFVLHLPYNDRSDKVSHQIVLDNRSDQPVTEIEVWLIGPTNRNSVTMGTLAGTSSQEVPELGDRITWAIDAVADSLTFPSEVHRRGWVRKTSGMARFEFHLIFTDARGQRWLRSADGTLTPKPPTFGGQQVEPEIMALSQFRDVSDDESLVPPSRRLPRRTWLGP